MITYSEINCIGDRNQNQDSILSFCCEDYTSFVVADGLGGEEHGEQASNFVIERLGYLLQKKEISKNFIFESIMECQTMLMDAKNKNKVDNAMTTVVMLLITSDFVQWGHVGDSRLYFFRGNTLIQRTKDHSVPEMLVQAGEIKESEIRNHPDRNKLFRALGERYAGKLVTLSEYYELGKDDSFLLCTDGFWEKIEEWQMEKALAESENVTGWLRDMRRIIEKNARKNNLDNYSAIAVWNRR